MAMRQRLWRRGELSGAQLSPVPRRARKSGWYSSRAGV